MAKPKRQRTQPTEEWEQLELLFSSPEQRIYEQIRPVVLFGVPPPERAREIGAAERTFYRQVQRFAAHGMRSLFATEPARPTMRLPEQIRQAIAELKAEHPTLHYREIASICYVRFNRKLSHKTVKRVLAETPPPQVTRRYPPFHDMQPAARRIAIIRLHAEGWNAKSIATYLQTSRQTVHITLNRWVEEGFRGLPNKSRAPKHPRRKVDFKTITAIRRLSRNPSLGAWRVHAALKRAGIRVSPRTCSRILALNRALYQLPKPERTPREPKPMPFRAGYRHQYWSVDIRYLDHQLGGGNIYVITILENYSRAVLASAISRTQDLTAYLIVLFAAIRLHGSPDGLVSDGGSVFKAKQALEIYRRLGIAKHQIDKGQAWQNYIETMFNVQRRMADYAFAQARSWRELQAAHDTWVNEYNHQVHWAHRVRDDGRETPAEVLDWTYGHVWDEPALHYAFYATRFGRQLDKVGYVRFRHYRLYAEPGLERRRVAVWLYKEQLSIEFDDTLLVQYTVAYQPNQKHFRSVTDPQIYETQYRSPQLPLWQFGDDVWLKILRQPLMPPRRKAHSHTATQQHLFT
ncbi:MAG: helix-turn-helix domain-containing protein [Chloroflexota bacterium]|nr:helix-turn-helix domain-containing protein [Chloroflexota bacterium]